MDLLSSISGYMSPSIQIVVLVVVVFAIRVFFARRRNQEEEEEEIEQPLPPMEKTDFTLKELRQYDGVKESRILVAVNGKVFDVTRGKGFYGPGGPYSVFAGRDASRGLATFCIDSSTIKDEYDDLSDLNSMQMDSVLEWEMQFTEKYEQVGKLLKPGEKHCNYKAEESEDESTKQDNKKFN